MSGRDQILELVDLARYPLDDLDGPRGRAVTAAGAAAMARQGWAHFDGFIRADALPRLAEEAAALAPQGSELTITRNIYGEAADASRAEDDPARLEFSHHPLQLADDQIGEATLIKRLYFCDALTEFVARVQGKERLYRYGDRFQALNIVTIRPGEWHSWHYDYNECTVTLLLQAAEAGGDFTFLPDVRGPEGEDTARVMRFLGGDMSEAQSFDRAAGGLTFFRGERSLHGVTPVAGARPRVTAILTYDEVPNRAASDEVNIRIYGERVARLLAP